MFKEDVKYCPAYKKWFVWNGKYWEQDNGTILEYAIHCVRSIYIDADLLPEGDQRKALIQHAMRSENGNKIKLLVQLASGMKELIVSPDDWDANPWLLNCQNGTINLKTGKLQPFCKEDYITRICSTPYDEQCQTPLWNQLLDTVMSGKTNMVEYLQRALGYSLIPENPSEPPHFSPTISFEAGTGSRLNPAAYAISSFMMAVPSAISSATC